MSMHFFPKAGEDEQCHGKTEGSCESKYHRLEEAVIELDIQFSEQKEAQFIKESYKIWQDIKEDMLKIIEMIKNNWDNKNETDSKGYFG